KALKKPVDIKAGKDTSAVKPGNLTIPPVKSAKDSTQKVQPQKIPVKTGKDSVTVKPAVKPVQ
ncbi:MAG: hypothetical protein ACXVAU_07500, partial [Mucilaginibacter sp.]